MQLPDWLRSWLGDTPEFLQHYYLGESRFSHFSDPDMPRDRDLKSYTETRDE